MTHLAERSDQWLMATLERETNYLRVRTSAEDTHARIAQIRAIVTELESRFTTERKVA